MMTLSPPAGLVLLVEDDENDAFFFCRAVERAEMKVPIRTVVDGTEAIDYLQGEGAYADRQRFPLPALVVLDLNMPRRNGFDVLTWIRGQVHLCTIPLIVLTSSSAEVDMQRAYERGANSYLIKPGDPQHLNELVKQVLSYWLTLNRQPPHVGPRFVPVPR